MNHMKDDLNSDIIEKQRMRAINDAPPTPGKFIIYWMQQAQRIHWNHALSYAKELSNRLKKPLMVYFGLTDTFPEANLRHYQFMIEGLQEVKEQLLQQKIGFIIRREHPVEGLVRIKDDIGVLVCDRGYLRVQKQWRQQLAEKMDAPMIQIESDVGIPVETASDKEEYAAYTIRPKINKQKAHYLHPVKDPDVSIDSTSYDFDSEPIDNINSFLSSLSVDTHVSPSPMLKGGRTNAQTLLGEFLTSKIQDYATNRNDPSKNVSSMMSPYLHFGQISSVEIAWEVNRKAKDLSTDYLEELIVRRELSMNFVHYNNTYDSISCLPYWAQKTLQKHSKDKRDYVYTREEFEKAKTHDPYWNAAQKQMMLTGYMHGYMRMYWGKKIIEWADSPEQAYEIALYLNNKYELDGRDPNGFTGVAWCFGKHDRPWRERAIFGSIRFISQSGLHRKGDIERYKENISVIEENSNDST